MSTKSKNTNVKSRTSLEMDIGFSKGQKDILEKMMREKITECVDNIMNSDSEGDDFEGDRDSFNSLFEKVFNFKSLKVEDNMKVESNTKVIGKRAKKEKDPNMPKKFKTAYFMWLWNDDIHIGMSKIKNDFTDLTHKQALAKAGQIWTQMTEPQKIPFNQLSVKDKTRYENEILEYNPPSSADADEDDHEVTEELEELDNFERKDNLFLYGYTKKTGSTKFQTLSEAVSALEEDEEATGVVKDNKGNYTVRKGKVYKDTPELKYPEICWKKL